MSNFDLASLALKSAFPKNAILTDDRGLPSVMVYVPKFKMSEVISGGTDSTHPAFIVDGKEKNGIYISKFQNVVYNNRAYSLPGEDPKANVNADAARKYCEDKGVGWHMMTAMEWGALALWCKKHECLPYGNNNFGKDSRETLYEAVPTYILPDGDDNKGKTGRVATGTGPITWSHNRQLDGIYDLNGNVWEWVDGMRLFHGELQILENNNAANYQNSKVAASGAWKAISGANGTLITPNGSGTTTGSLKLDYVETKWKWITGAISSGVDENRSCKFADITADTNVKEKAKELLYALALLPDETTDKYDGDFFWANNLQEERFPLRGGSWHRGADAGVFSADLHNGRTNSNTLIGFRSAFYD